MAIRFRRSIKITKGVRLNVSKKGVGVSVGTRGMRYSVHSSGRRTRSVGIPGTGLSYVKTSTGKKKKTTSRTITPSSSTNLDENAAFVEEHNQYIHDITSLHQISPQKIDWREIQEMPAPFSLGEIGPLQQEAMNNYQGYSPNFLERVIKKLAEIKKEKLKNAIEQAENQDQADYQEWKELNSLAEEVLAGKPDAYKKVVEESREFEEINFQFNVHDANTVEMEFQVNGEEIPTEQVTLTKTGKISKRQMGKTKYHEIKKDFVCSQAIWMARHLFAYLPINNCVIHVTENGLNTATGYMEDQVLVSVFFDRENLDKLNFDKIDPSDAMENFQHHIDHLKTKGFRAVERITEW